MLDFYLSPSPPLLCTTAATSTRASLGGLEFHHKEHKDDVSCPWCFFATDSGLPTTDAQLPLCSLCPSWFISLWLSSSRMVLSQKMGGEAGAEIENGLTRQVARTFETSAAKAWLPLQGEEFVRYHEQSNQPCFSVCSHVKQSR